MNRIILLVILVVFSINIAHTQSSKRVFEKENYSIGIGPLLAYKMGVNAADPPQGIKNGLGLAAMPDFGLSFYLPLNPDDKMGLLVDAAYANYAYLQKFDNSNTEWTDRFNYISLTPQFYISGFVVGLNIGIPLGGERVYENRTNEIPTSSLATMFEFKLGGNFTLNESEMGRLNFFINAGYQINGQYTDELNLGSINYHPASLQLGLSYIFNME